MDNPEIPFLFETTNTTSPSNEIPALDFSFSSQLLDATFSSDPNFFIPALSKLHSMQNQNPQLIVSPEYQNNINQQELFKLSKEVLYYFLMQL